MTDLTRANDLDPRIYRAIWKGAGKKNVRELADQVGLSVADVLRIKNELLESVDILTIDQKRTKAIVDLQEVADRAREMAETAKDERALSGLLTSSIQAMKTILAELARIEKQGNKEINALNALRQREVVRVYEEGHLPFIEWLVEEHGLDRDELEQVSQGHILEAARKMDERNL